MSTRSLRLRRGRARKASLRAVRGRPTSAFAPARRRTTGLTRRSSCSTESATSATERSSSSSIMSARRAYASPRCSPTSPTTSSRRHSAATKRSASSAGSAKEEVRTRWCSSTATGATRTRLPPSGSRAICERPTGGSAPSRSFRVRSETSSTAGSRGTGTAGSASRRRAGSRPRSSEPDSSPEDSTRAEGPPLRVVGTTTAGGSAAGPSSMDRALRSRERPGSKCPSPSARTLG